MIPTTPLNTVTVTSVLTMIAQVVLISGLVSTMLFLVLVTVGRTLVSPRPTGMSNLLLPQRNTVAREAITGQIRAVKIMHLLNSISAEQHRLFISRTSLGQRCFFCSGISWDCCMSALSVCTDCSWDHA